MTTAERAPAADESAIRAFTRDRFIELFLSQSRRAQLGIMAVAALVAFIWLGAVDGAAPWLWGGALAGVTLWRMKSSHAFVHAAPPEARTARIGLLLALNGVLMALPLTAFGAFSEIERAALSMLLIALSIGSVASTAGYRRIFLAFAATMLVPLALAWALADHPGESRGTALGLAVLVIGFLAFISGVARQQSAMFEDSCRVRFAEQRLNAELQTALANESEANRAKTQFLAAASHDLRQPIHSMNVLVAALQMRELDPRSQEIAQLLGTVNQTLSAQLDALLDISKLDAGTVKPENAPVALDALLRVHFQTMEPVARSRGLACDLQIDAPVSLATDAALLTRVISNLTDNAIKYNRPGGRITVRLWRQGAQACLSVADTGIGIDPAEQAKVFREFYQVGNVARDRTKGLGLGLSIVQRLGALLGLTVELRSAPGEGTTVTLRLPAPLADTTLTPTADARPGAATEAARTRLDGLCILVVDDEAQVRDSMALLLSELGGTVFTAEGTADACDIAQTQAPVQPLDAVLCDLRLRDGDDGLRAIAALRPLAPQATFALISGDTAPERLREAAASGVPLLHKPVPLAALIDLLKPSADDAG